MEPRYLHLLPEQTPPVLTACPFRAVFVAEDAVSETWRNQIASWIVKSGCLNVVAWGIDVEAVEGIDAIACVDGIDALFIGRADLTVAYNAATPDDEIVVAAVDRIVAAGKAAGRGTGMFLGRASDVALWHGKGASLYVLGSDYDFILQGAAAFGQAIRG